MSGLDPEAHLGTQRRLTFGPEKRIRKRREFAACYQRGKKFYSRSFILFVLPRPGQGVIRLGLAVGKKTGNAVQRNRIKRVVREVLRIHQHALPKDLDLVVVAKRSIQLSYISLHKVSFELLSALDYAVKKSDLKLL